MKLHEFHVLYCPLCTIYHGNSVAGRYGRIGSSAVNLSRPSGSDEGVFRKNSIHEMCAWIQKIGSKTGNMRCPAVYFNPQMMFGNDINNKSILDHFDLRMLSDLLDQNVLNFSPRTVFVMQYTV